MAHERMDFRQIEENSQEDGALPAAAGRGLRRVMCEVNTAAVCRMDSPDVFPW